MDDNERRHRRLRPVGKRPQVLVGVDPSPCATMALRWAAREARLRGAALRLVHIYSEASPPMGYLPMPASSFPSERMHRRDAKDLVQGAARAVAGEGLDVTAEAIAGRPESVLVRLSGEADLLVVGSSGHHPLFGLLLGSVAQHCVRHARCPVVVVPMAALSGVPEVSPDPA